MSITYGIIKKFNGNITVESKQGVGTTISVSLPAAGEEIIVQRETEKDVLANRPSFEILVIDDEENIRELLKELLQSEGHHVTLANCDEKGLEIIKESKFQIVVTDLNMPGISGWDLARQIKQIKPETFIIILTGR